MHMRVLSTNLSQPRDFEFQGQKIRSSMIKRPSVDGLIVKKLNIENDIFDAPKYHCREHSVVYAFSWPGLQSYAQVLSLTDIQMGDVGENLSLSELDEAQVFVGDQFQVGEVLLEATSPRIPCSKLNFRFQSKDAQRLFIKHGKSGVYFRVLRPGRIQLGALFQRTHLQEGSPSIQDCYDLLTKRKPIDKELVKSFLRQKAFPDEFREQFQRFLVF